MSSINDKPEYLSNGSVWFLVQLGLKETFEALIAVVFMVRAFVFAYRERLCKALWFQGKAVSISDIKILTYFSASDLDPDKYVVNRNHFGNNSKFKM